MLRSAGGQGLLEDWRGIVLQSLRDVGGRGSLDQLYADIAARYGGRLAPTWQSIVRRTLGDYCRGSAHFRGEHLFEQINPGYWKLSEELQDDDLDGLEDESAQGASPSERIAKPFDPLQIKISRRVVTVGQVVQRIGFGEVELAPDFQRRARLWDATRKSRLIESIMLRIPLPVFYVAADQDENWKVVDGLQRLTTIYDFVAENNPHKFALSQMEYLSDYEGLTYEKLPRGIIRRIDETELNINVIESGTPEQVMFNIFKRLNTGGLILNNQEVRHALNPGPAREFLQRLCTNPAFLRATDGSVNDTRMGARELALRFVAFFLTSYSQYNEDDLDGFLNQAMVRLNKMDETSRRRIEASFVCAMERAYRIFGEDAFRKRFSEGAARNRVNRALFEAWSVTLAALQGSDVDDKLATRKAAIRRRFIRELNNDYEFADAVSVGTGSRSRVTKRFSKIEQILQDELNA